MSSRTPDPDAVSGAWNTTSSEGILTVISSTDPNLDYYSVRTAPAPYHTRDESVVGIISKTDTTFHTNAGLAAVGSAAYFKVCVVLNTAHEKGRATVKITRAT